MCLPIIALIPDTRMTPSDARETDDATSDGPADLVANPLESQDQHQRLHQRSENLIKLFKTSNMILAVPVFLVGLLRPSTLNVLIQYTSIEFGWKLSEAVILVSEVAAVNLILFLLVVPQTMILLRTRYQLHPQTIDLAVVRGSMLFLSLGALFLGLAPNLPALVFAVVVFATGFGCRVSILALVTSWASDDIRARLYGVIQIIENAGMLMAEPLLQNIFAASLKLSKAWSSLTFIVAAAIYATVCVCTLFIELKVEETI